MFGFLPRQIKSVGQSRKKFPNTFISFWKRKTVKRRRLFTRWFTSPFLAGGLKIPLILTFKSPGYVIHLKIKESFVIFIRVHSEKTAIIVRWGDKFTHFRSRQTTIVKKLNQKKKKKLPIINESPASDDEFKDKENLLEN